MHGCAYTKQVKSRAKAMKNKANNCNTPRNTRAAIKSAGGGPQRLGPTRAV